MTHPVVRVTIPPRVRERILAEFVASLHYQSVSILHPPAVFPRLLEAGRYAEALAYIPDDVWGWYE